VANELKVAAQLGFARGDIAAELSSGIVTADVAGTDVSRKTQLIGFAGEEALDLGDITVGGFVLIINRDSTNFVSVRAGSGLADLAQLLPGDPCLFRIHPSATPFLIADTADVLIEYVVVDL